MNRPNVGINVGDRNFNNLHWNNWQNHSWHDSWHHGCWHGQWAGYAHGYWDGWTSRNWWQRPAVWGAAAWGVGAAIYSWGYVPYSNPFYTTPVVIDGGTTINYSQPLQIVQYVDPTVTAEAVPENPQQPAAPPVSDVAMQNFDSARSAFYQGDYASAMASVNQSLSKMPNDAALHEFRALVLFAQKDYKQAAATIYAVLAVGPGWDWTTLSGLYPSVDVYSTQLRSLESFVKSNPNSADGKFLLAYHYLTCGHNDAAKAQLEAMLKIVPGDTVATQLLQTLTPPPEDSAATTPSATEASTPATTPAKLPELAGQWKAERKDGAVFTLAFAEGSKFVWTYKQKDRAENFEGTYTLGGSTMVLEATNGNTMVGHVEPDGAGFRLMLMGGPPGDPGLSFQKS